MELMIINTYRNASADGFIEQLKDNDLCYYASDAASEMEFEDINELHEAVKRSIEICLQADISVDSNFKGFYKSSYNGLIHDWKLSLLGYKLICLNGRVTNPTVARKQIELLKNQHS